jgi:hypothetical protein
MALIKGNITVIGSNEESAPKKCEYCGKIEELRPYGINGANICFECGMKPENRATTDRMFSSLLDEAQKFDPNNN